MGGSSRRALAAGSGEEPEEGDREKREERATGEEREMRAKRVGTAADVPAQHE
jgi:hypothetical protein